MLKRGEDKPSSSCVRVATPSTAELPLRTATAFLVAAKTVKVFEREKVRDWGVSLTETPEKDDRRSELGWNGDGATTALAAIARFIVRKSEKRFRCL